MQCLYMKIQIKLFLQNHKIYNMYFKTLSLKGDYNNQSVNKKVNCNSEKVFKIN